MTASILSLAPPYRAFQPWNGSGSLPRGSMLAISLPRPPAQVAEIGDLARRVRTAAPAATLVLQVADATPTELVRLARCMPSEGISGINAGPAPDLDLLRVQLTDTSHLADEVLLRLEEGGCFRERRTREAIHEIIDASGVNASMGELLRRSGSSLRSWHRWLAAEAMGSPGQWFRMARALRAILALQRDPLRPMLDVALSFGYSDSSGLSRRCKQQFGVRPGEARRYLGWVGLFAGWREARPGSSPAGQALSGRP